MDDQLQLSALSALCAIATLALSAMAVPSRDILGLDRSWSFALRCSPVVCVFASLDDLIHLARSSDPPTSSSSEKDQLPGARVEDGSVTGGVSDRIAKLRSNVIVRTLWTLLTLSQLIKVFLTQNARSIQVICGVYTLSLAINLATNYITRHLPEQQQQQHPAQPSKTKPDNPTTTPPPPWRRFLLQSLALSTSLAALVYLTAHATLLTTISATIPLGKFCSQWLLPILFTLPTQPLAHSFADNLLPPSHASTILLGIITGWAGWAYHPYLRARVPRSQSSADLAFSMTLGLLVGHYGFHKIFGRRPTEEERRAMEFDLWVKKVLLMGWWVGMHGVGVAVCLGTFYEVEVGRYTVRPAWTGYQG